MLNILKKSLYALDQDIISFQTKISVFTFKGKGLIREGAYLGVGAYYWIKLLENESYCRRKENMHTNFEVDSTTTFVTNIATNKKYEKNKLISTKTM